MSVKVESKSSRGGTWVSMAQPILNTLRPISIPNEHPKGELPSVGMDQKGSGSEEVSITANYVYGNLERDHFTWTSAAKDPSFTLGGSRLEYERS